MCFECEGDFLLALNLIFLALFFFFIFCRLYRFRQHYIDIGAEYCFIRRVNEVCLCVCLCLFV